MNNDIEIVFAVFLAILGIALITKFSISAWKKPTRTVLNNTVLLSILFVVFILMGAIGIVIAFIGILMHPGFAVLGLLVIALSVVLSVLLAKAVEPNNNKATESQSNSSSEEYNTVNNKNHVTDGEKDYDYLEDVVDNNLLMYSYERDICLFEYGYMHLAGNGGKDLRFVQEPDNPYDNNAVAIYLGENKLGYVYRNDKTQKMINDWIRRGEYFTGYLNKFSVKDKKATFKIGFYKPLSRYPSKIYSLVRTGKKIDDFGTRADNLRSCNEYDVVKIFESCEYPFSYTVCDDLGNEIGELPKSAEKFLENCNVQDVIGIIREIDDDYETAPKAKVEIFEIN